jgi:hypothetical protein
MSYLLLLMLFVKILVKGDVNTPDRVPKLCANAVESAVREIFEALAEAF